MTLKPFFVCAGLMMVTPALADFHYTPSTTPMTPSNNMNVPAMAPLPPAPVEAMPITAPSVSPMPRSSANAPSAAAMAPPASIAPVPMMQDTTESLNSAGSYNTIEPLPLTPSVPSWKTSAPATIAAPQMRVSRLSGGTVVEGFANQIPLVIALRQVVPESYQLTYGTNVPLGSMVDWNGGKPWKDVLMNTLTPLGLTASENGTLIKIDRM